MMLECIMMGRPWSHHGIVGTEQAVSSLSTGVMGTYDVRRPRGRFLTKPSEGTHNDGYDNDNHDLVVHVDMVLDTSSAR